MSPSSWKGVKMLHSFASKMADIMLIWRAKRCWIHLMLIQTLDIDSGTADTPNTNLLRVFLLLVDGLAEKGIIPFHWYPSLFPNWFSFPGEWGGGEVYNLQALREQQQHACVRRGVACSRPGTRYLLPERRWRCALLNDEYPPFH